MELYEEAVLSYITASHTRFVCPQFDIPWGNASGGSCPDFLALDFKKKTIYVIEVSSAATTVRLHERSKERETRWYEPIRQHFKDIAPDFSDWRYRVTLFVRGEVVENMRSKIADWDDVAVRSLDDVVFGWRWNWQGKHALNELE